MKFKSNIEIQAGLEDASGSPGTVNQLLSSTVTGTAWIDPSTIVAEAATLVVIACKNTSGAAIAQGTPVYQTGTVGATATIEIAPADALISANKLPAIGLLQTALSNNGFGNVVITGELTNFTTDPIDGLTPTTGDKIFVKSGGGLTLTKPTGEGNGIQNMGLVGKVSSGNSGSITVSSIMRTNDVPNLPEGRIWVGDGNTIVSDTVYVDEPNNRVGIGTTSPGATLELNSDTGNAAKLKIGRQNGATNYLELGTSGGSSVINAIGISGVNASLIFNRSTTTATTQSMIIDGDGNVGIGTTSPDAKLDIEGDFESIYALKFTNTKGTGNVSGFRSHGVNGEDLSLYNGANRIQRWDQNGNSFFDGNVGIGTDSPSFGTGGGLQITNATQANLRFTDTSASTFITDLALSNDDFYIINRAASGQLKFRVNASTEAMTINSTGNVGIGTTSPGSKLEISSTSDALLELNGGTTANPYMLFAQNGTRRAFVQYINGGLLSLASEYGDIRFMTGTGGTETEKMRILSNGNVGIGTTSPSEKLDVVGNIELNGALYIGSRGIYQQENTDVSGLELVANASTSLYRAAFFDYVIQKTGNVRAGTVFACNDGGSVEYTETSTNDIGDTSDVVLSVDISGGNMRLLADAATSGWSVKSLIRAI